MDVKRFFAPGIASKTIFTTLGLAGLGAPAAATTFFYDPATGTVALDTATSPTGQLTTYELEIPEAADIQFLPDNHVRLSSSPFYFSEPKIISDRTNAGGFSGYFTLGEVLPAGLNAATWHSLFPAPASISWHDNDPPTPSKPPPPAPKTAPEPKPASTVQTIRPWWQTPEPIAIPGFPEFTPLSWAWPEAEINDFLSVDEEPPRTRTWENYSYAYNYSAVPRDDFSAAAADGHRTFNRVNFLNGHSIGLGESDPEERLRDDEIEESPSPPREYVPRPGDVYTSDIESNPAFQNGPVTFTYGLPDREFDNGADLLDPETLTWAQTATLRYDPSTGGVTLDTTGADSGYVSAIALESPSAFRPEGFVSPVDRAVISLANAEMVVVITDLIVPGVHDLGAILDAGLALDTVESVLSESSFTTRARTESGRFTQSLDGVTFRVTLVPEPTVGFVLSGLILGLGNRRIRHAS